MRVVEKVRLLENEPLLIGDTENHGLNKHP